MTATFEALDNTQLKQARERLLSHPLYEQLNTRERVQVFMKHHVFAVWDFFSLLKRLQQEMACITVPWSPQGLGDHARFITDIIISKERDDNIGGSQISHFELYLGAMAQIGADRGPIARYIQRVSAGADPIDSLDSTDIPPSVRGFTSSTLRTAVDGEVHEVAASFCHSRENMLADLFSGAHANMTTMLDEIPLLDATSDGDAARAEAAMRVAIEAVNERSRLWDGVVDEIMQMEAAGAAA